MDGLFPIFFRTPVLGPIKNFRCPAADNWTSKRFLQDYMIMKVMQFVLCSGIFRSQSFPSLQHHIVCTTFPFEFLPLSCSNLVGWSCHHFRNSALILPSVTPYVRDGSAALMPLQRSPLQRFLMLKQDDICFVDMLWLAQCCLDRFLWSLSIFSPNGLSVSFGSSVFGSFFFCPPVFPLPVPASSCPGKSK